MTQTLGFGWTYSTSTSYVVTEFLQDGTNPIWTRTIDPVNYQLYLSWIQSNTPVYLSTLDSAGNPNVTFVGGVQNTAMYPGYTVWIGGLPSTNSQVAIDQAAAALAVAQAFTNSRQWIYFNQIVTLVAADTAAGSPWAVISQATFNLWRTWEMSVLTAFEAYVATPSTANMTALNTALAANPPMNL